MSRRITFDKAASRKPTHCWISVASYYPASFIAMDFQHRIAHRVTEIVVHYSSAGLMVSSMSSPVADLTASLMLESTSTSISCLLTAESGMSITAESCGLENNIFGNLQDTLMATSLPDNEGDLVVTLGAFALTILAGALKTR